MRSGVWGRWVLGLFAAYFMAAARAAEEAPAAVPAVPTEVDFLGEIPIVLFASRLNQPLTEAPAAVTIIDRDMIKASGALEIAELLRLVPGFQVGYASAVSPSVTYHGFADTQPKRMQVLIDGRGTYLPTLSDVQWGTLGVSIEDIERIEVVRGSNGPAYGSNAFVASINIVTRQPFENHGTQVQITQGSLDTRKAMVRYAAAHGPLEYRVTGEYRQTDGFPGYQNSEHSRSMALRSTYALSGASMLEFDAGIVNRDSSVPKYESGFDPPRQADQQNDFLLARWRHSLPSQQEVHVQFYYNHYRAKDWYTVGPLSTLFNVPPAVIPVLFNGQPDQTIRLAGYDGDGQRADLELQYRSGQIADWRFAFGGSIRLDRYSSPWLGERDPKYNASQRIFGQAEWRIAPNLLVNLGTMTEHDSMVGTHTSPRIALNYQLTPTQALRASRMRAYRSPSMFENYVDGKSYFNDGSVIESLVHSDATLRAERLDAWELGYVIETGHFSFDIKWFREKLRDLIANAYDYTYPEPNIHNGAYVYVNDGQTDTHGIEGGMKWRPAKETLVALNAAYARRTGEWANIAPSLQYDNLRDTVPMHTVSALLSQGFSGHWNASLAVYHMDRMEWLGMGETVDGYDRVDARVAKGLTLSSAKIDVALIVHNLFDNSYVEFRSLNDVERRVYLQLDTQF